ncbi:glutamate mutase L [Nocardioides pacificus]
MREGAVVCVDFGSTFTKAALVDLTQARIVAAASHPTTIDTDVLDGYDACLASLAEHDPRARDAEVLACSSAGGGLRIAVVGNEELVTAEAGRRVALSSGGTVVAVLAAGRGDDLAAGVESSRPDVVLLTGGTDGGNAEPLLACARQLVDAGWRGPVVVAGNVEARDDVAAILGAAGTPYVLADNVVPRIGILAPDSARAAVREVFLAHVIGGKHLSARADFVAMVQGATPDVVLTGVELLARGLQRDEVTGEGAGEGTGHDGIGDVVVVDVGGATTDVHSVVEVDPDTGLVETAPGGVGLSREVVATTPVTRTVEGDLGMRWSAVSTLEAAVAEGLEVPDGLARAAAARRDDPSLVPTDSAGADDDEAIARAAVQLAMRRHAGRSRVRLGDDGRVLERTGKDLREVALLIGSGGVLRHGRPGVAGRVLAASTGTDVPGGWQLPRAPRVVVDTDYVLAAAGLLAARHPEAAHRLVRRLAGGDDG